MRGDKGLMTHQAQEGPLVAMISSRQQLAAALKHRFPSIAFKRLRQRAAHLSTSTEPELRALRSLARPEFTFLDIGANEGLYAAHLKSDVRSVHLFEPVPDLAKELTRVFATDSVHSVALSNISGSATLWIPIIGGRRVTTRSTVEIQNQSEIDEQVTVRTETLSALAPPGLLMIKIDVEGHELQVVNGGSVVLAERAHVVLFEAEERHAEGSSTDMVSWFSKRGFVGWVMLGETMLEASLYDPTVHQSVEDSAIVSAGNPRPASYGNNFLFVRGEQRDAAEEHLREAGFTLVGQVPQEVSRPTH